jgi:hypothetical protein
MTRVGITVLAIALFLPLSAQAQQWSAEQQEIWEFEKACWETDDLEVLLACFHQDYVGWADKALSVPLNKADRRVLLGRSLDTEDQVFVYLKPLDIRMHGNVAVVLYIATGARKNKATGEETTFTARVTDICLKQGGSWAWIADHESPVEDDD